MHEPAPMQSAAQVLAFSQGRSQTPSPQTNTGSWRQPVAGSQVSVVQALPSSQLLAAFTQVPSSGLHVATVHKSGAVQVTGGLLQV
jgi:hypothetical protein